LWAGFLTLLDRGPWLLLAMCSARLARTAPFHRATDFSSGTPFEWLLVVVSAVVSAEITTKLVIVVALFAAALGAFRACRSAASSRGL